MLKTWKKGGSHTGRCCLFQVMIGHNLRLDCATESQWRHCRIWKTATYLLTYVTSTCDVIVTCCSGKKRFHVGEKFVVFVQNAVERKLNTLEIKFLHVKCQSWPSLYEINWEKWTFLVGTSLYIWKVNLPSVFPSNVRQIRKFCKQQVSLGALQHPTSVQVKLKQTKVTEDFAFKWLANPSCNYLIC